MIDPDYDANFTVVTPQELIDLRAKAAQAEEYLATAKRVQADFLNFQDRARAEKEDAYKYSIEKFLRDLIPALDAFDSSLKQVTDPAIAAGIEIIQKEILRVLAKWGVQPISSVNQPFDPRLHQAVAVVEAADKPDQSIVEELKPGFILHDRVLRPALVKVSRAQGKP
jgi:molecular chaperone GrpE